MLAVTRSADEYVTIVECVTVVKCVTVVERRHGFERLKNVRKVPKKHQNIDQDAKPKT